MLEEFGLIGTNAGAVSSGDRFGRLVVLATGQIPGTYRYMAVCQCDCGSPPRSMRFDGLLAGAASCGCIRREKTKTHGESKSIHYHRWRHMMDRCYNSDCAAYPDYGGRGIQVCDEWHDVNGFIAGLPDGYFDGSEIDRINNDGNYEPGNVRWVVRQDNCRNRRSNRLITFNGETKLLTEWAEAVGIQTGTLWDRLESFGWSAERALTTPVIGVNERMAIARSARWAGHQKATAKPKPVRRVVEFKGKTLTLAEMSAQTGISTKLLYKRIFERGWAVDRAAR